MGRNAILAVLLLSLAACDRKPAPAPSAAAPAAAPAAGPVFAAGESTFHFGGNEAKTNVGFRSKTDITDIIGQSRKLRGTATIDFQKGTGRCALTIPTATLNSGMDDRDRAMLGKQWLDAKQFPTIEFKADQASFAPPGSWKIPGKFSMHGVTKDLEIAATVRYFNEELSKKAKLGDGAWIKVTTSFIVKLADYGIVIPENAVATVKPEIEVSIDVWGCTVAPANLEPATGPADGEDGPIKVIRPPKVSAVGIAGKKYVFGKKPQLAQFAATSETELEKVTAATKILGGLAGVDAEKGSGQVRLALPVTSLKTGIAARDEHMLSAGWLDSAKFPLIEFESTKAAKKDAKTWAVEGTFTMHGVKKPVALDIGVREIPLELVQKANWGDKPGMAFSGTFKVKLSEFGIKISEQAAGKVNDEWTVTFEVTGLLDE